jgi:hypothetical protein
MSTASAGASRKLEAAELIAVAPATYEEIAVRAYELWERRGCPEGSSEEDWFAAEAQLNELR